MLSVIYLIITLAATGVTVWQLFFQSPTTQNADYTIAMWSLMAAIIFGGLFLAGRINRERSQTRVLFE